MRTWASTLSRQVLLAKQLTQPDVLGTNAEPPLRSHAYESSAPSAMTACRSHHSKTRRQVPWPLTRREREVGALATQGMGNREISERLFISKRTTENHLARVYEKFGITSRAELVRLLDSGGTPAR